MASAPRSFFRIRYRTAILLLAVGMILWSGFSYWYEYSENSARRARELHAPPLGVTCTVKAISAEQLEWTGKIIEQSERWIVLQTAPDHNNPMKHVWIPRERIESIAVIP